MAWTWIEGWPHGRVWRDAKGGLRFYVRRGKRDVALGATTVEGALAALARLEATGNPRPPPTSPSVMLDEALVAEYLAASEKKGNAPAWRRGQRQHLRWWQARLGRRDLRTGRPGAVTIAEVRAALDGAPSARQREAVIRHLYAHLRGLDRVTVSEDPLYGRPHIVPAGRPAQWTTDKTIAREDTEVVLGFLDAWAAEGGSAHRRRWGDVVRVLQATGMHVSEVRRFAAGGAVEALPASRRATRDEAAVVVIPLHKSGTPLKMAIPKAVVPAARRVLADGPFSEPAFYSALRLAAEATGATVKPGRYRHTLARRAVDAGATVEAVGNYLGHKSAATTRRFYATLGVPVRPRV
jgi:integrase